MPVLHVTTGLQDVAVHTTVTPAPEIVREAALTPEIPREAAGEAVLMNARSAATQAVKFAKDVERNIIMTMSISHGRAGGVMGIKTTAIPGMSHVIHVVVKGVLTAIGGVKPKNKFHARAAMERSQNMFMWKLLKRGLAVA
jgi:hypothetical protein